MQLTWKGTFLVWSSHSSQKACSQLSVTTLYWKRGLKLDIADIAISLWNRIQNKIIIKSYSLAGRVVCLPFLNADGFGHIVAHWKGPTMKKLSEYIFLGSRSSVSLVVIEDLWSQLALPRLKGFLVMLCKDICDSSVDCKN